MIKVGLFSEQYIPIGQVDKKFYYTAMSLYDMIRSCMFYLGRYEYVTRAMKTDSGVMLCCDNIVVPCRCRF